MSEREGVFARFARRKREVAVAEQNERPVPRTAEDVPAGEPLPDKTDADMPPLESLTLDSDYSGFLSPKVSEQLRRIALRKLFHMPSLNVVDGLDDYAEDFTSFAPLGEVVTHEMRSMLEREAKQAVEAKGESDAQTLSAPGEDNETIDGEHKAVAGEVAPSDEADSQAEITDYNLES